MHTFPLRLWIPITILLLFTLLTGFALYYQYHAQYDMLLHARSTAVRHTLIRLQRSTEEALMHGERNRIEQDISAMGIDPEIRVLALLDPQGKILSATRYAWKQQTAQRVMPGFSEQVFLQVLADQQPAILISERDRTIFGYIPVRFPESSANIRSHRFGAVVLDYDISRPIANIWSVLIMESSLLWAAGIGVMLVIIGLLNHYVARPIAQLATTMQHFTANNEAIVSTLRGNGELAILERAFSDLTRRLTKNHRQLITQKNLYRTLSEMNQMLVRVENEQQLYQESCEIVVNYGGFVLAWIGLLDEAEKQVKTRAKAGSAVAYLDDICISTDAYRPEGLGPTGTAITRNKAVIVNDFFAQGDTAPWQKNAQKAGIQASAAFPISCFNRVVGALNIYADKKDYFTGDIVELLAEMANDISFALDKLQLDILRREAERALLEREEKLAVTLHSIGDAVITTDIAGLVQQMNPIAEYLTGWSDQEAAGQPLEKVFHIINSKTRATTIDPVRQVLQHGKIVGLANDTTLISRTGTEFQIADSAAPIRDKNDLIIGVILVFQDISEQYAMHAALRESEERFRHVNEATGGYIWEVDMHFNYTYVTDKVLQVKGYPPEQLLGHNPFEFMHPDDIPSSKKIIQQAIAEKTPFSCSHRNLTPSGEVFWEEVRGIVLFNDAGEVVKIRGAGMSINERKKAEMEIARLAYFAPLTNLPNRRMIQGRLEHEFSAAKRHNIFGALLFIDLDHFKNLNDSLGHDAGDELLIQIAGRLVQQLRTEDTAARLGGDEFIILLGNISNSLENAAVASRKVTEKIQAVLRKPYRLKGHDYHCNASIGITLFPQPDQDARTLFKQADTALYRAKKTGRNMFQFYRPEMQEAADKRLEMEKNLRQAIARNKLQLYFQPQYDQDGRITGTEALLRWLHPSQGMIPPNDFIPVAEESGLIVELGEWVLKTACTHARRWQQKGLLLPGQHLSINVSAQQFQDDAFVDKVANTLSSTQFDPDYLVFEVTESLFLENIRHGIDKMHQLHRMGINFSVDDFGTGYSSLAYLKRLPLSELKIDKAFVDDISTDCNDRVIIETIIAMAQHLRLRVIAEGVENHEQLQFLKTRGCNAFQGYLFSRPLHDEAFAMLLQQQRNKDLRH